MGLRRALSPLLFNPLFTKKLCDGCNECIKACHGSAISQDGKVDTWRCAVYYNGANGSKNPFMPPEAFANFDKQKKMAIINGTAEFNCDEAKEILSSIVKKGDVVAFFNDVPDRY